MAPGPKNAAPEGESSCSAVVFRLWDLKRVGLGMEEDVPELDNPIRSGAWAGFWMKHAAGSIVEAHLVAGLVKSEGRSCCYKALSDGGGRLSKYERGEVGDLDGTTGSNATRRAEWGRSC